MSAASFSTAASSTLLCAHSGRVAAADDALCTVGTGATVGADDCVDEKRFDDSASASATSPVVPGVAVAVVAVDVPAAASSFA